ncbi:MAG: 2-oxoglutarate dehydrogenase, E2 component, dihydrolipoamide succinyltransferase, partial [Frankiaceae bacterium]
AALAVALAAGAGALVADLAAAATGSASPAAAREPDRWVASALAATLPVLLAAVPAYLMATVALA